MPHRTPNSDTTPAANSGNPQRFAYQIIPQAPPLDAHDLDDATAALEVVISWGDLSVLHVAHLTPPRAFYLGAAPDTDFVIGEETLGSSRLPLVLESHGDLSVVIPHGADAQIDRDGEHIQLAELAQQARLQPVPDNEGARSFPLQRGITARITLGDFTFIVRSVAAAQRIAAAGSTEPAWRRSRWTFASAAAHLALFGMCYFLPPRSSALSMDRIDTDSRLVKYAIEAREQLEEPPTWLGGNNKPGGGERAAGDEGEAGDPHKPKTHQRRVAPETSAPKDQVSREEAMRRASDTGLIRFLKATAAAGLATSQYNAARAASSDPAVILGSLVGEKTGASGGNYGIGMIGRGRGGGGTALGTVAQGGVGTRGRGAADGDGYGLGEGVGSYRRRAERVPQIRQGVPDLHGALSKEIIRRVIGRHINEIRYCYESQLIARPDLQGRVAVNFVISPTGAVTSAAVAQTDVRDVKVESCIAAAVRRMTFPAPEGGGLVIVTYPFLLSQTGE